MFNSIPMKLKVGFLINPWAGIGGSVALKGSDGTAIRQKALNRGAIPKAQERAEITLELLQSFKENIQFFTVSGDMGADSLLKYGFNFSTVYAASSIPSESSDTIEAVARMQLQPLDLLIFAGGDGTARDVYDALNKQIPVIGIPAGTKIHSGVYCITPHAAGEVIAKVVEGKSVDLVRASVMDINEDLFRQGKVNAKQYGELYTVNEPMLIQASKSGSVADESLNQLEIAEGIVEDIQADHLYVIGSGTTVAAVMEQLSLENTLLGIDLVLNGKVIGTDVSATQLNDIIKAHDDLPKTLFVTVIGGQGHVFGRGNQQLSPEILHRIGKQNIQILATKSKIIALKERPLISDSGDIQFDHWLSGRWPVTVGYKETLLYLLQ